MSDTFYEVELKFAVPNPAGIVKRLAELGAEPRPSLDQVDRYFNHPSRDFSQTDEALRIRSVGDVNCITYKGPVVDAATKMRLEIEPALGDGTETADQFAELLMRLGFHEARGVRKRRVPYSMSQDGWKFEVCLDEVAGLGTFVEIETLALESDKVPARDAVLSLARQFELENPERRSYLRLLIDQDAARALA